MDTRKQIHSFSLSDGDNIVMAPVERHAERFLHTNSHNLKRALQFYIHIQ